VNKRCSVAASRFSTAATELQQSCNRAATELQQSCNSWQRRALVRGNRVASRAATELQQIAAEAFTSPPSPSSATCETARVRAGSDAAGGGFGSRACNRSIRQHTSSIRQHTSAYVRGFGSRPWKKKKKRRHVFARALGSRPHTYICIYVYIYTYICIYMYICVYM
jgi:hypothetical protein